MFMLIHILKDDIFYMFIQIYQIQFLWKCDTFIALKNKRLPTLVLSHIFRIYFDGPLTICSHHKRIFCHIFYPSCNSIY